jgi:hypothetical protein
MRISSVKSACAVLACGLLAASAVSADSLLLRAENDPANVSFFTLDFGKFGGETSAVITSTQYVLKIDPDAHTARFVQYHQELDPLMLPGGISTGDLTIEIVPDTSSGTYDPATGEFTTSEFYAIHFTGNLKPFGLTSPIFLPSDSNGTVRFDGALNGTIQMVWNGAGELQNPNNPNEPISFEYACTVNTLFDVPGCGLNADLDGDGQVALGDLGILLNSFGCTSNCSGDLDGDDDTDLADLGLLLADFGAACP